MKRILLKLSGEALAQGSSEIYDVDFVDKLAGVLKSAADEGYQLAVVVGAGNIWRGRQGKDMDRTSADRMGMLATVINSICLKDALIRAGAGAVVMTSVPMSPWAVPYTADTAISELEEGKIVILGGGLGVPFVSTDSAAAIRAAEISADAMYMAKNVDYLYTDDPKTNPDAKKIERISAAEVLALNLRAIDATATAFCMSNAIPIHIFGLKSPEDIIKALRGEILGTVITAE